MHSIAALCLPFLNRRLGRAHLLAMTVNRAHFHASDSKSHIVRPAARSLPPDSDPHTTTNTTTTITNATNDSTKEKDRTSSNGLSTGALLTLLVTISGTLVSSFITQRSRNDTLRKNQLERVSDQLSKLYGPMFATAAANDAAWKLYFAKYLAPDKPAMAASDWSVEQKQFWAQWMELVFMKYNRRLVEIILMHTDLLVEDTMPLCLLDLFVHTDGYEVILERWKKGDFRELQSLLRYNDTIVAYAEENYAKLKAEQCRLLSTSGDVQRYSLHHEVSLMTA